MLVFLVVPRYSLSMKIGLFGYGKMGKVVEELSLKQGHFVTDTQDADICIDFSHPDVVIKHIDWCISHRKPVVIGTTGWDSEMHLARERVANSSIAVFFSANFSLGMFFFIQLLKQARAFFLDYEIAGVEYHHSQKKDSPSGTAITIAQALEMTPPFTSVRCGRITGKHEVIFDSFFDTITLTHEAHNREGFAQGALKAAQWILGKQGWYTFNDMFDFRSFYSSHHAV